MTYKQLLNEMENKKFHSIYLFSGEEPYYIDLLTNYIAENALTEAEKAFNQTIVYGKDTSIDSIIGAARRYPMASEKQVVIIKEAQDLKDIDDLIYYVEKPLKSTIFVISHRNKAFDKRKKLYKAIEKAGEIFESKKLYDNQIPEWISEYLKDRKFDIQPDAAVVLTESLGADLKKIANELDKLLIMLPQGTKRITTADIEKNVGISKDFNNFELNNAISEGNILKANRIINYFAQNQKDNNIIVTIATLFSHFQKILTYHFIENKNDNKEIANALKINPFFVKDYKAAAKKFNPAKTVHVISLLREYDLKSKGVDNVSSSAGELLKELIFKIMH